MVEATCTCGHRDVQHFKDGKCDVLIDYGPDAVGWSRRHKCLCEHFEATTSPMLEPTPDLAAKSELEELLDDIRDADSTNYWMQKMLSAQEVKILAFWPTIRAALERTAELEAAVQRVAAINTTGNVLPTWASEPVEELRRVLYGDKPFLPRES